MRRHRLLAILILLALLAGGCGGRKSTQYVREADTLFHLGKYDEAAGAYRRAAEFNPKNALALVGEGRCLLVQQQFDEALAKFREALDVDPTLEAAYQEEVRLLMSRGAPEEALALAKKLESTNAERGGILVAYILRETGKTKETIDTLRALRDQFPKSAEIRVNLAAAYLANQQLPEAEAELKSILDEVDAQSIAARMGLIDVYEAQGKTAEMLSESEKLVQDRPGDLGLQLGLARSLLVAGRIDDAEQTAKPILEQQPDSGWANQVIGACLLARRQYTEAVPYLQKAAAALPQQAGIARQLDQAKSAGRGAGPAPARTAAGTTQSAKPELSADWRALWKDAALRALVDRRDEFLRGGDPAATETITFAAFLIGNASLAQELAKTLPDASPLRRYFQALESKHVEQFMEAMKQWQEKDPERSVLRENAFGFGLALMGGRARAVQVLSACRAAQPEYRATVYTLARVFQTARMPRYAARCLKSIVTQVPGNMEIHSQLYALLREANLMEDAQKAAEMAYSLFPNAPEAIFSLAQSYLDSGELDLAMKVLDSGLQSLPNDPSLLVARARVLLHAGKPAEAMEIVTKVTPPSSMAYQAMLTTAFAAAGLGKWDQVTEVGKNAPPRPPGAPMTLLLAAAALQGKRVDDAIALMKSADPADPPTTQPEDETVKMIRAVLTGSGNAGPAHAKLQTALGADPAILTQFVYGNACLRAHIYASALPALQAVYDKAGASPALLQMMFLAIAHVMPPENREAQARELAEKHATFAAAWIGLADVMSTLNKADAQGDALVKAVGAEPEDAEAWRQLAAFRERQNDTAAAIKAYEHILALAPDDPFANNNLAYALLMTKGDLDKALACAQAAQKQLHSDPQVLHTLGLAYLRRGDLEESLKNLRVAIELRPGDPTMLLDFGLLLIAQKQVEEGKKQVEMSLRYANLLGLDFPRRAEAENIVLSR